MEDIFEIILECVLDGIFEASKSSKTPKYIRYPLIGIIFLLFIAVFGLIFFAGILALKEDSILGIILILLGLFLLSISIIKLRKTYLAKMNKEQS